MDANSGRIFWAPTNTDAGTNIFGVAAPENWIPNLSVTNEFEVLVVLLPQFTQESDGLKIENGVLSRKLNTLPGKTYQILFCDCLESNHWDTLTTPEKANSPSLTFTNQLNGNCHFYRINEEHMREQEWFAGPVRAHETKSAGNTFELTSLFFVSSVALSLPLFV